jgi:hypothetical protein
MDIKLSKKGKTFSDCFYKGLREKKSGAEHRTPKRA